MKLNVRCGIWAEFLWANHHITYLWWAVRNVYDNSNIENDGSETRLARLCLYPQDLRYMDIL